MNLRTFDSTTFATLLGAGAMLLTALHLLQVRRRKRTVATLLFWQAAARTTRARSLLGRFRHPRTWAFLLALLALLLAALAEPQMESAAPTRALVLDAGAASAACLDELRERARDHGAERTETALIIAGGGSVQVFAPGSSAAARRAALAALASDAKGIDALEPLLQRAAALARMSGVPEVVLLSPRATIVLDAQLQVLRETPRALSAAELYSLLVEPTALPAQQPQVAAVLVDADLPPALQALGKMYAANSSELRVHIAPGIAGDAITMRTLVADSVSGVHSALHDAALPLLGEAVKYGISLRRSVDSEGAAGAPQPAARVLLRAGSVPLVVLHRDGAAATLLVQPDLFAEGSRCANDPTLMALLLDWIACAGAPEPAEGLIAGQRAALSVGTAVTRLSAGDNCSASYGALALIEPTRAGIVRAEGHAPFEVRAYWPELMPAEAHTVKATALAPLALWEWLALTALLLLCLDAWLHARGRIP